MNELNVQDRALSSCVVLLVLWNYKELEIYLFNSLAFYIDL